MSPSPSHSHSPPAAHQAREAIVLALDVADLDAARACLAATRDYLGAVKVGKELFTALGPASLEPAHEAGLPVFLDLKFHDIPNTVAGAVRAAARHEVRWLTLHVEGGAAMLRAAAEARDAQPAASRPRLLGVTVLTSQTVADPEEVVDRALLAQACGLDGVIASPREVAAIRAACGPDFEIFTPGVRPAGAATQDQQRVATPAAAIAAGADRLVVGRPLHAAPDPAAAARELAAEVTQALADRAGSTSPVATAAPRRTIEDRLLDLLRQSQAFFEGHFVLTSGLHSDRYVQCARLLMHPHRARRAGIWLADRLRDREPQVVLSVALGGLVIGQEVAAALGVPALFAERDAGGSLRLRRGFTLAPGTRVAIVDDVCTKGGSIAECAELVEAAGARVVVTGAIIDRSRGDRAFDLPFEALARIEARAVFPEVCPACDAGIPTEKPGSRPDPTPGMPEAP